MAVWTFRCVASSFCSSVPLLLFVCCWAIHGNGYVDDICCVAGAFDGCTGLDCWNGSVEVLGENFSNVYMPLDAATDAEDVPDGQNFKSYVLEIYSVK